MSTCTQDPLPQEGHLLSLEGLWTPGRGTPWLQPSLCPQASPTTLVTCMGLTSPRQPQPGPICSHGQASSSMQAFTLLLGFALVTKWHRFQRVCPSGVPHHLSCYYYFLIFHFLPSIFYFSDFYIRCLFSLPKSLRVDIYLAVLGVRCILQRLLLQHMDSLAVAHGLSSCSVQTQLFRGMRDLSSLTRDQTQVPCIVLDHQGSPTPVIFRGWFCRMRGFSGTCLSHYSRNTHMDFVLLL